MKKQPTFLIIIFFICLSSKAQVKNAIILTEYPYKGIPHLMIEVFKEKEAPNKNSEIFYLNKRPWPKKDIFPLLTKMIKEIKTQHLNIFFDPKDDSKKLLLLKKHLESIGFSNVKYFKVTDLKFKFLKNKKETKKKK